MRNNMLRRFALLCTFSLLLLVRPAFASDTLLRVIDKSEENGFTLWVAPDHTLPLISIEFALQGEGARNDPDGQVGISQLMSNTLDEGAGDLDAKAFQGTMADNSISLGFWSARDDFGGSVYTLSDHKDIAFNLLDLALNKPLFAEEAVQRMIAANLARLRSDSADPNWMAARLFNATLFAGHPYARNSGGTLASLAALTPDNLRTLHKSVLLRDRLVIAIAGDITPNEARQRVQALTRSWAKAAAPDTMPDVALPEKAASVLFTLDIPQTMIQIGLPGIAHDDPDYPAAVVMNHIFGGGGFGSRLTETVREKHGLTYGISSDLDTMDKAPLLSISTSTKNESAADVLRYVRESMEALRTTPVSETELNNAKSYLTGSLPLAMTSLRSTAQLMNSLQRDNLPATYLDAYVQSINKVTAADVQRLAKRLLRDDKMQVVLVGKPKGVDAVKVSTIPGITE